MYMYRVYVSRTFLRERIIFRCDQSIVLRPILKCVNHHQLYTFPGITDETTHVRCPRCGTSEPIETFEQVATVAVSREYAFQKPKFDTQVQDAQPAAGTKVLTSSCVCTPCVAIHFFLVP